MRKLLTTFVLALFGMGFSGKNRNEKKIAGNKMKQIGLSGFLIGALLPVMAQTGPAGVGTSANNVLWLKADAGTSTTTDGAALSSWTDQSGNGINVSQSTAAQKPAYKASLMNSMPAVEFDNNNTSGQNDFMTAADNSLLDNTAGYSFFTVTRMKTLDGNARSIMSKRTTIDTDEAFMFFYYSGNSLYLDVDGLADRFATTATYAINTNYILDAVYDGTLASSSRSKIYEGETLRKTGTESSSTVSDKTSPLMIGATHATDNRPFGGYISEIIIYRTALNDASRTIVNNYLSAKYNITLSANDKYAGDNTANGDFDREVAGIGQESSGTNTAFATSVAAGLGITATSGLDNGDYILAGHNTVSNSAITSDINVVSGGPLAARWNRIWYIDVTNTSTAIGTNMVFDLSDGGITGLTAGTASNYKLLYRSTNSGNWTIVATASSVAGDRITFSGYSFPGTGDGYYTIGTLDFVSPLPIELLSFEAVLNGDHVDLSWVTASEKNNAYFSVERSKDGELWAEVARVNGAGNSNQQLEYADIDPRPLKGVSYYRLKQTDADGNHTYSNTAVVRNNNNVPADLNVYPNPSEGDNINLLFNGFGDEDVLVVIRDIEGRTFYSRVHAVSDKDQLVAIDLDNRLSAGTYLVVASSEETIVSRKIIVR